MNIGDLVNYITSSKLSEKTIQSCLVLDIDDSHRQRTLKLFSQNGTIIEKVWVGHVEEVSELSDVQLEKVRGGMSTQIFSFWRSEMLNDYR